MPGGRPTKYREEYAEQVYKLCLLGATDEQIADFFEVSVQTIHNWTAAHDEFLESRKRGKQEADAQVAEALFHRALGYTHPEEKIFQYEGEAVRVETLKHYPPDTTASIYWLGNRQPDKWRHVNRIEHSGPGGGPIETRELSDDELQKRATQLRNRLLATASANGSNGNGQR